MTVQQLFTIDSNKNDNNNDNNKNNNNDSKQSPLCRMCRVENETVSHILTECKMLT